MTVRPIPDAFRALLLVACACTDPAANATASRARDPESRSSEHAPARPEKQPAEGPRAAAAREAPSEQAARPPRFAASAIDDDVAIERLANAEPTAFKPVGSTATVFRMRLRGEIDAAFKVASHDRPFGPVREIAAYRIARCIGLDGVPPAIWRELPIALVREKLDPRALDAWPAIEPRLIVGPDGMVRGAAIYWIAELAELPFDGRPPRDVALEWLRGDAPLPDARRDLARSLSDMLLFDWLIANGDRWSGGNVMGDAAGKRAYIRDHDLAFSLRNELEQRKQWQLVTAVERFSRASYAGLGRLDRACIERELALDVRASASGVIGSKQLDALLERRAALISHVDALIAERGEANVLVFP